MKKPGSGSTASKTLRKIADELLRKEPDKGLSSGEKERLVQECRMQQAELEDRLDRFQRALRESEESRDRYRDLFDFAPMGYLTLDARGLVTGANLTAANMLGIPQRELVTRQFLSLVERESRQDYEALEQELREKPAGQAVELRLKRRGKESFFARVESSATRAQFGALREVRLALWDVTEKKLAEEKAARKWSELEGLVRGRTARLNETVARLEKEVSDRQDAEARLAREKELLAVTLRSIADGVATTDERGRVLMLNRAGEELSGWEQSQAGHKRLSRVLKIIDERTRGPLTEQFNSVFKSGQSYYSPGTALLVSRSGKETPVAASLAPILSPAGKIAGAVAVLSDLTSARALEQERAREQRLESLRVLAGGLAHDFNNILMGIMGNVSMVRAGALVKEESDRLLENAEQACVRAKGLTQQLLAYAIGGAPAKKITSLPELVMDSASFALSGARSKFRFSAPKNLWPAEVDPGQISQVISNLVSNAAEALPAGKIEIGAQNLRLGQGEIPELQPGRYLKIWLRDHGPGIPKENLSRIFDPFFTTKEKGGLGLTSAYSIVRRHDGKIVAESAPGQGSVFSVYLPAAGRAPRQAEPALKKGKGRVLVMDDEQSIRDVAGAMLWKLGYAAEFAGDGKAAVKAYLKAKKSGKGFDAVLMDLVVPGAMDGKEATREIIKLDPKAKIIASTGYSTEPLSPELKKAGFLAVIAKPYDLKELGESLQKIIKRRG